MKTVNREAWLQLGVQELSKQVFEPVGLKVPKVNVSVSIMSSGTRKQKNLRIGENWHTSCSTAGNHEIFMNPFFFDRKKSSRALDVLAHELIHAIDNNQNGHGKVFRDMAIKIGLTGKMRATEAGPELKAKCDKIVKKIGEFPHDMMTTPTRAKKQGTRNIKVECDSCDFSFRTSRKNIEQMNEDAPCPCCGRETEIDEQIVFEPNGKLRAV